MDILPVVEISEAPELPIGYKPSAWALRVAARLEELMRSGVQLALVHLNDDPRVRTVGPSQKI